MSRATLTSLLAVALTAALAVGCSSEQRESAAPAPPAASPSPAGTDDTPSATPKPTASEPTASESPAGPTPSAAPRKQGRHKVGALAPRLRTRAKAPTAAHLLVAEDLPVLAGDWTAQADGEDSTVGACQKTDLVTIGATETSRRTFTADGATATQVVARFADTRSAWRAHKVLTAWRDDCAERLGRSAVDIGPLAEVRVPIGTGASYRAAYRRSTAGLGILRTGTYLTVLEITTESGDYPLSWEPARVAVRRVARTFDTA